MSDAPEGRGEGGGNNGLAQARAALPALPADYRPITWEGFGGLNLRAPRAAIADAELAWCDGWMPVAPSVLRTLPDVGASKFTAEGATILWLGFGNIGDTNYGVVLQSDGAVHMFNTADGSRFEIMTAGTIVTPGSVFGFSQWGSTYLLFAKDQTNGYWLWDGTSLFTAGTINPDIEITASGSDYTSAPTITMSTTGSGAGVTFSAEIDNGAVTKIPVTMPGSGFAVDDFVTLTITGGGSDDQAQPGVPVVQPTWGGFKTVTVFDGGSGYTDRASAVITGGSPVEPAEVSLSITSGTITAIGIFRKGAGYTSTPTITVTDPGIPGSPGIPGGTGFQGEVQLEFGQIASIAVSTPGSGYLSPPSVLIVGDGIGAQAYADVQSGQVIRIRMTDYGTGYTKALAVLQGGNNAANALASVFPFGNSGTAIETYQSRVWIANGAAAADFPPKSRVIYSDPSTPTGFGNGGGAFKSNDSFLKIGYFWLKQSNGFLYLGGDSSTNYISGVATSAASDTALPVTTFSNQNVDPQIGSPWPNSVQVFSRNVVCANAQGVQVSYGGAMTKVSTPIDPLYATCPPNVAAGTTLSSAVAHIFNIPVYMLLMPVTDFHTGDAVNKLLMWDGKRWFTSQQSKNLTFIATQEVSSTLTAWGTDGTDVFPLFQVPGTDFTKVAISRFFAAGYYMTKTMVRLQGVLQVFAADGALTIGIDSDNPLNAVSPTYTITPAAPGSAAAGDLQVWGPIPVGQWGRFLGYTLATGASDIALLSVLGEAQDYAPNV